LNASSEGEIRTFYDWIGAYQESFFRENLTRVMNFIQLSLFGDVDPDIVFAFEPLWSLDEKAMAEVRKTDAETDQVLIDSGVLAPVESRHRIAEDPESAYSGIDKDAVPEPPIDPDLMGGENTDGGTGEEDPDNGEVPEQTNAGALKQNKHDPADAGAKKPDASASPPQRGNRKPVPA